MRILVSNDDGIYSSGIQALSEGLSKDHEIYVVAPDRERSATGHSLTLHRPLRLDEVTHLKGIKAAYSTDGTPSDCIKIAIGAILDKYPDIVISGINHGPNMGTDVLYSGTVSAAMEGAIFNIPSIAVSLAHNKPEDFEAAVTVVKNIIKIIDKIKFPDRTLLNINVPPLPLAEIAGIKITELGVRPYNDYFEKRVDPRGRTYYWLAGEALEEDELPGTDVYALRNNQISITPVTIHMTHSGMMTELKEWIKQIKL
ncbi:MAG: 5'/3'-nucleotidase SurE [Candidatus Melainabacteria bacterium]|nr:5'/3'-nucleotidase SurE [Candidatus Melainabacteria bacterium]